MRPRLDFARKMAGKYLRRHRVTAAPVEVEYLLVLEGVQVELLDFPPEVEGESWWEGEVPHLAVNRSLPRERLRFTLAHELGHLALRHHQHPVRDLSFLRGAADRLPEPPGDPWERTDLLEAEANAFAGELLLPRALFAPDWERHPQPHRLARKYEVSVAAVYWRVQALKMREGR
ncbi:MAG: ImmA/IrrE family metallo-endopeptidase [Armatimonadota bacterium]